MGLKVLPVMLAACWSASSVAAAVDKAALDTQIQQLEQLHQQYQSELEKLKQERMNYEETADTDSIASLKAMMDRVHIFGFFRAKYDHDDREPIGSGANNKHFYMDLEGKMKVSDDWNANFQIETRKGYTVTQSWRNGDNGSSDQDGTLQRIWVEGRPGGVGVTLGTKWWGYGFQAVPFGHAADGVQLDYDVLPGWNAKAFWLRPRQGDLVTMPNSSDISIAGANLTGSLTDDLQTSLTFATNDNKNDAQKMDRMGAFELQYRLNDDFLLRGAFAMTNAEHHNTSQEYRIDYKDTDLAQVGSYGLYLRYIDFRRYGDYSHDDEWGSLPSDAKGGIFGVKYVLFKNVVWETFYSVQERFRSGGTDAGAYRHLFRTQIDFHF
ncbi:PspA/IM30 family protein [Vibrio rhizosphaerae]|uniref:Porin n=1 Tax=Vibrio rhizosphaerae TaxID=398736 RepID=A0ABU4IQT8_9VIBR|nr:hypothetical protein [Vibrio rhizosphaerae]MDW6091498.1 hypothetical protein [Vibrio rhizosphaerae]